MKRQRQEKMLAIILERDIDTQEGLAEALSAAGFLSTQATISRDIRELGLTKEVGPNGAYRYVVQAKAGTKSAHAGRLKAIFKESLSEVQVAQNLVVIKTLPGLASAACAAIDSMEYPGLVGTLAGDDTAFLAMEDKETAENFRREIADML